MSASTLSIPVAPEAVTAEWLGAALPVSGGARITDLSELDRHAGTTGRLRLGLSWEPAGAGPASVFVKLPPFDDAQRAIVKMTDMGRREARFYAQLAPELPVRVPRVYFSACDDSGERYVMVLEDLVASGCSFPGAEGPDAADRARRVVQGHAAYHALLWESPRFEGDLAWIEPPMRHELGVQLVSNALDLFADQMPPAFAEIGRIYVDHHAAVCDLWEEGERTLLHGDSHLGNLFEDHGRIGFLDWAVCSRGPGIRDVAYYVSNSMPTALRRAEERSLLDLYRAALREAGAPAPDADTLWRRYRLHVAYSWVAAATTASMGEKWQPRAITQASMERATAAVADLETVALFRAELGI